MKLGVPNTEPYCVWDEPLPLDGWSVRSPAVGMRSLLANRLGQAPVDDQRLAVFAEHDVAGLQIAVQHAAAVGVFDGVADVDEALQQLAQFERPLARLRAAPCPRRDESGRWRPSGCRRG